MRHAAQARPRPQAIVIIVAAGPRAGAIGALAVSYAEQGPRRPVVAVIVGVFLSSGRSSRTARASGATSTRSAATPRRLAAPGINVTGSDRGVHDLRLMAGVGGVILASRLRSVDTGTGGGKLLLNAIAAAVIGGTSLFGGHGAREVSALLGGAVIAIVANGMDLLEPRRPATSS